MRATQLRIFFTTTSSAPLRALPSWLGWSSSSSRFGFCCSEWERSMARSSAPLGACSIKLWCPWDGTSTECDVPETISAVTGGEADFVPPLPPIVSVPATGRGETGTERGEQTEQEPQLL